MRYQEIERKLRSEFHFSPDGNRSPDHIWLILKLPDLQRNIRVKLSRQKGRDISKGREDDIAEELLVTHRFFLGMMRGEFDYEDFLREIKAHPRLPRYWNR